MPKITPAAIDSGSNSGMARFELAAALVVAVRSPILRVKTMLLATPPPTPWTATSYWPGVAFSIAKTVSMDLYGPCPVAGTSRALMEPGKGDAVSDISGLASEVASY